MKSHKKLCLFMTLDAWCIKMLEINSVDPLYLIINKINGYFERINGSKYLTLFPTNER